MRVPKMPEIPVSDNETLAMRNDDDKSTLPKIVGVSSK
jgi:hypothetical protein